MNQTLIDILNNTYTELRPSKIEGIGVFAVRDIPKGSTIFGQDCCQHKWTKYKVLDLEQHINPDVIRLLKKYFILEKDMTIEIPDCGLKSLNASFYVNHSTKPNCYVDDHFNIIALRDIKRDEELTYDYKEIDEHTKGIPQ